LRYTGSAIQALPVFVGGKNMVVRMKITLEQEIYSELLTLALSELRTPESQLLIILRKELDRHNEPVIDNDPS
jgi:hypothetical protein